MLLPLLPATFPLLLCRQENLERHSSAQSGNYHGALFIKQLHKLQQQSFMSVISHPLIWFAQKSTKAQRTHNLFLWCITIYDSYFKYFAWCNLCVIFILFLKRREGELRLYPGSLPGGNSPSVRKQAVSWVFITSLWPQRLLFIQWRVGWWFKGRFEGWLHWKLVTENAPGSNVAVCMLSCSLWPHGL